MKTAAWFSLVVLFLSSPLMAKDDTGETTQNLWSAWGGSASIRFNDSLLNDLNVQLNGQPLVYGQTTLNAGALSLGSIEFRAPYGLFDRLTEGSLQYDSGFSLKGPGGELNFSSFRVEPHYLETAGVKLVGNDRNSLLLGDHIHFILDEKNAQLQMLNIDIQLSEQAATALGYPEFTGLVIAQMHMRTSFTMPPGEDTSVRGLTCANRPLWPSDSAPADVGLIAMGTVQQVRRSGDRVFVAPSATLKNVGVADVPWQQKFTGVFPPYGTNQHPFLVWSMYRVHEGKFQQIGRSGVKHAFLTINFNCTLNCNDNQILWPGCEDVYGVGNNDSNFDLGPRAEIEAAAGIWEQCGSFFDPGCVGNQTNSSANTENRLGVLDSDLGLGPQGAEYFFQAWYVVRDDINIFNTMGKRPLNPSRSGNVWNFNPGTFSVGATIDEWVDPVNPGAGEANITIDAKENGSAKLALKTEDLGNGVYRYFYALNNFDIDVGITEFSINLAPGTTISNIEFLDIDENAGNQWAVTQQNNQLTFTAPAGEFQLWDSVYNFTFDANAEPVLGTTELLINGDATSTSLDILAPSGTVIVFDPDMVFSNGFE